MTPNLHRIQRSIIKAQAERIELPFTYTYDQFTVFFHGDNVFVERQDFPSGRPGAARVPERDSPPPRRAGGLCVLVWEPPLKARSYASQQIPSRQMLKAA